MTQNLKEIRVHNNLSQRDIAKILNIPYQQYQKYEYGKFPLKIEYLIKLAQYYNTSTDYILGLTDEKEPYHKI